MHITLLTLLSSVLQSYTNKHTHMSDKLVPPINLWSMSLDCGRNPDSLEKTHTYMRKTSKLLQRRSSQDWNQDLSAECVCVCIHFYIFIFKLRVPNHATDLPRCQFTDAFPVWSNTLHSGTSAIVTKLLVDGDEWGCWPRLARAIRCLRKQTFSLPSSWFTPR